MAAITGTTMVALFLERRGYEVLATSWTCEAGTVDVVARAPEGEIVWYRIYFVDRKAPTKSQA